MPYFNAHFYRCYDGGTGAFSYPTLLLHGLGGSHLSWPSTIRRIPGQRNYALDLPGHGASQLPACSSIECHTHALHQFITGMDFYRVNLVGHSMGAAVAYAYASNYPERVRKLSLISFGNQFRHLREMEYTLTHYADTEKAVALVNEKVFHPDFSKHTRREILRPLHAIRHSCLFADVQTCLDSNLVNFPRQFRFPIQFISGGDDQIVPAVEVRTFAAGLTNTQVEIIKGSGHMVVFEKTDSVIGLLKAFLEKSPAIWH